MAKTDVAVKDTKSTALALATSFRDEAHGGFEDMSQEDYALPFLKLMTNTSPEVGVVDGALPGTIYNTVTGEIFDGKAGIRVVPCAYSRQYIEWSPRGTGSSAPVAIYPATSDILSQTHREPGDSKDYLDNGNYVENTANYYVMLIGKDDVPTPALISMKSTQLKKARKWNSMAQAVKMQDEKGLFTPPIYSQIYKLTTTKESNDKGQWFGWEIEREGAIEDAQLFMVAKEFHKQVSAGKVQVKHQSDDEAASAGGGSVPF
jgi:hypothetical protein